MIEVFCGNSTSLTFSQKNPIIYVSEGSNHALLAVPFHAFYKKIKQHLLTNVLKNRCSTTAWKTAALEFLFNKVEGL